MRHMRSSLFRSLVCPVLWVAALGGCHFTADSVAPRPPLAGHPPTAQQLAAREKEVLSLAEAQLRKQLPAEYAKHKPFAATQVPHSDLWEVKPASGAKAGAPFVKVNDDGTTLSIFEVGVAN